MPWLYRDEVIAAGDLVIPQELTNELGAAISVINGNLDRDNFPAGFFGITNMAQYVTQRCTYYASDAGLSWTSPVTEVSAGTAPALPTSEWMSTGGVLVVQTLDGALEIRGGGAFDQPGNTCSVEVGLRIDGEVVAQSSYTGAPLTSCSPHAFAIVPVGAGPHTVELMFRVSYSPGAARTVTGYAMRLMVREMRR